MPDEDLEIFRDDEFFFSDRILFENADLFAADSDERAALRRELAESPDISERAERDRAYEPRPLIAAMCVTEAFGRSPRREERFFGGLV